MKYVFLILTGLITSIIVPNASARSIYSFQNSIAIMTISQFMYDVAEDVTISTRLSDKKIKIKDFSQCTDVRQDDILTDVRKSIKQVLRFYPDEELPLDQAILDLADYLDNRIYKKCIIENKSSKSQIVSRYYTDVNDTIHLRLDNVALIAE